MVRFPVGTGIVQFFVSFLSPSFPSFHLAINLTWKKSRSVKGSFDFCCLLDLQWAAGQIRHANLFLQLTPKLCFWSRRYWPPWPPHSLPRTWFIPNSLRKRGSECAWQCNANAAATVLWTAWGGDLWEQMKSSYLPHAPVRERWSLHTRSAVDAVLLRWLSDR